MDWYEDIGTLCRVCKSPDTVTKDSLCERCEAFEGAPHHEVTDDEHYKTWCERIGYEEIE